MKGNRKMIWFTLAKVASLIAVSFGWIDGAQYATIVAALAASFGVANAGEHIGAGMGGRTEPGRGDADPGNADPRPSRGREILERTTPAVLVCLVSAILISGCGGAQAQAQEIGVEQPHAWITGDFGFTGEVDWSEAGRVGSYTTNGDLDVGASMTVQFGEALIPVTVAIVAGHSSEGHGNQIAFCWSIAGFEGCEVRDFDPPEVVPDEATTVEDGAGAGESDEESDAVLDGPEGPDQ